MRKAELSVRELLDKLEKLYGKQKPAVADKSLDPSWREPELLMSLAWSKLNQTTPDVSASTGRFLTPISILLRGGYPPSNVACAKGWEELRSEVGTAPRRLLEATSTKIALAVRVGGLIPELRATRLKHIAKLCLTKMPCSSRRLLFAT
jgi:hypothetical protein